uniref:glutaredoxin n=1 Tax=Porphyridium aerugineum TaxID=2792 RepID=UPI001FCE129B|nr:glutaredoxin [Porphyridium aerugineum]UNJ17996.1 glutaredoxin [Porphyridium aerugineum]
MQNVTEQIEELINSNTILLFMKGTKLMPMCGFSNTAVQVLNLLNYPYETYNVLENNEIREEIKKYSNWPTIPQLYIKKEFIGGADIILNLYKEGLLQEIIEKALAEE